MKKFPTLKEQIDLLNTYRMMREIGYAPQGPWNTEVNHILYGMGIETNSGATRQCIILKDSEWVIKIDIKEECGYFHSPNLTEKVNYQRAVEADLEDYFAEMFYLGQVGNEKLYCQRKAECVDEGVVSDLLYNYYECDDCDLSDYDRAVCLIEDSQEFEEFIGFIQDNYINDLHEGNWGYIDGHIVVVDYAGYQFIFFF